MRTYEVVIISAPNTAEDELTKLTTQLGQVVTDKGGKITKIDSWGRRKLAYRIEKFDEGIYTILYIESTGSEIAELERRLRVSDVVFRYLSVRTDEDLKRAEKMKALRRSNAPGQRRLGDDFEGDMDLDEETLAEVELMEEE